MLSTKRTVSLSVKCSGSSKQSSNPDVHVIAALLDTCGRSGLLKKVDSVSQKMEETPPCEPNSAT